MLDAFDHTVDVVHGGYHDYRDGLPRIARFHMVKNSTAIHSRHADVEQHQVDLPTGIQKAHDLFAAGGLQEIFETVSHQQGGDSVTVVCEVVDHQDGHPQKLCRDRRAHQSPPIGCCAGSSSVSSAVSAAAGTRLLRGFLRANVVFMK